MNTKCKRQLKGVAGGKHGPYKYSPTLQFSQHASAAACYFGEAACMEEQFDMLNCRNEQLTVTRKSFSKNFPDLQSNKLV